MTVRERSTMPVPKTDRVGEEKNGTLVAGKLYW